MAGSTSCWTGPSGGWTAALIPAFSGVRQGAIGGRAGSQVKSTCGLMPCSTTCWTGAARGWPVGGERTSITSCELLWQLVFGTKGKELVMSLPTSKSSDRFVGVSQITPSVPGSGRSEG